MIGFYDYTVIATYLATLLGLMGIFQAMNGKIMPAIFCLLLSGMLDLIDGRIARTKKNRTDAEKLFGVQIDSLNDMVCFGILPSAIAYAMHHLRNPEVPVWYMAALCFFSLCGLIRLAYFNVLEEDRQSNGGTGERKHYLGLPITASTLLIPLLYLLCQAIPSAWPIIMAVGMTVGGLLYILPLHFRHPNLAGIILLGCFGAAELACLIFLGGAW